MLQLLYVILNFYENVYWEYINDVKLVTNLINNCIKVNWYLKSCNTHMTMHGGLFNAESFL